MVIIKKLNNSNARVIWEPSQDDPYRQNPHIALDNIYSIYPEGFQFNPLFHKRRFTGYDARVHLYKMLSETLPLGLVREAVKELRSRGWNVQLDPEIVASFSSTEDYSHLIESFCNAIVKSCGLTPRDYQKKILELALLYKRVAFRAATGAGKSLAIYMIVRFFRKIFGESHNILILVPSKGLVNQLFQNFEEDYKWADAKEYVGLYHSDYTPKERKAAMLKPILVSTWHSMGSLLENKYFENYFKRFGCLIIDELHTAKNDHSVINRVVSACSNAEYRYGLTGTIPRHILNQKVITGNIGEIKQIISSKELIERGELCKATVIEVQIPYDKYSIDLCRKKKIKLAEEIELVRLTESVHYATKSLFDDGIITPEQNTLILLKNVKNGEVRNMVEMLKKNFPDREVREVHGGVSIDEREEIRLGVENKKGVIIVATYKTFGTGINMKNLHNVIFASSYKAYTLILQSIGRSLRLHKSKNMARIFDMHHMLEGKYYSNRAKHEMEFRAGLPNHFYVREDFYYEEQYPQEIHVINKEFTFEGIELENIDIANAVDQDDD